MPRFHPLHPRASLRRIKTAFGPTASLPFSATSNTSQSPLSSSGSSASELSAFNFGFDNTSTDSLSYQGHTRQWIRSARSPMELQQEEERSLFAFELAAIIEPRPVVGPSLGGIEEVLEGRV